MQPLILHPHDRILVLAPHPDDESLATGGLIRRALGEGARVRVVFVTDGENNPWPQRAAFRRWSIGQRERARWSERRGREAVAALRVLGLDATHAEFWHCPDQGLTDEVVAGTLGFVDRLAEALDAWRPTLLVAPSRSDLHPDHNAIGLLAGFAVEQSRTAGVVHLSYLIHGHRVKRPSNKVFFLDLRDDERLVKRQAVSAHGSQMILSRRRFLGYVRSRELFFQEPDSADFNPDLELVAEGPRRLRLNAGRRPLAGAQVVLSAGPGRSLRVKLPLFEERAVVHAGGSGAADVALEKSRRGIVLALPENFVSSAVWVKLAIPWRFLDVSGWQRLVLQPSPSTAENRVCCVIPCYNIAHLCGPVVREAARFADQVLAVDDGSSDDTRAVLETIAAQEPKVRVLVHGQNAGKGAALLTAFRYALSNLQFDTLVTLDGDAQHRPEDIPRLARALRSTGAALVIGEREQFRSMPLRSRIGNELTGALFRLLYSNGPRDTQSGFRALSREFVGRVVQVIQGRRYETELYMLMDALEHSRGVATVPIPTVYLDGNRSSHFNPVLDSLRIFRALLRWSWGRLLQHKPKLPKPDGLPRR